jgi:hypothetical protein
VLACLQTLRAIADGADVRGFYYWTLVSACSRATAGLHCEYQRASSIYEQSCSQHFARILRLLLAASSVCASLKQAPCTPHVQTLSWQHSSVITPLLVLLLLLLLLQVDNFEWNAGYLMEFGLYAWQPDGSVDRKLKEGAKALVSGLEQNSHTLRICI